MEREAIEEKVLRVVGEHFVPRRHATLTRDTTFNDDLEADDMDRVELIMDLEEEFDIDLDDEQTVGLITVGDAIDLVTTALARK